MNPDRAFFLEAGNLALDLLNTGQISDGQPGEQLRSPSDLRSWLSATSPSATESDEEPSPTAGPGAALDPPSARILLLEAHRLRDDIAGVVEAKTSGAALPEHVLHGINRVLDASRRSSSLTVDGQGMRLIEAERGTSLLGPLVSVARAAAELVTGPDPDRIRRCASATCDRWFLDTSKGGRRKWCSMATCGNRAKAATHRRKHGPR